MFRRTPSHRRLPRRAGFILLFGSRPVIGADPATPPIQAVCPRCQTFATLVGKTYRRWFTLFFLPVFPVSGAKRFSECTHCHSQFPVPLSDLQRGLSQVDQRSSQQAITLYNSLRQSPANSITLNDLMLMYASMKEYEQAVSAARDFPEALHNSEQCMSTLGRVYLALDRHDEAIRWFDAALARNSTLGEALYHKAIAYLTKTPPEPGKAVQAARAARKANYPRSEELLAEAETKARGEYETPA